MRDFSITDTFGRRTKFAGQHLVAETTDSPRKPQWVEIDVWRTEVGNFIVRRTTRYRVRHLREDCSRLDGYERLTATTEDTYRCGACNKDGKLTGGGWAQDDRTTVDVYLSPEDLAGSFCNEGRYSTLARTILADVAEQDDRVDDLWNSVVVP